MTGTRYPASRRPVPHKARLRLLKRAGANKKLGGPLITKGRYRGQTLYSLTLEERATCPSSCANWDCCYGDNMPFAHRYPAGPELEAALDLELEALAARGPFTVRLHVLGDFYSVAYVERWADWTGRHPELHVFGYTHWPRGTPIGDAVERWASQYPDRVSLLRSDGTDVRDTLPRAMTVGRVAQAAPGTVLCPEQTHGVPCSACGLCMSGRTAVSFRNHARAGRNPAGGFITLQTGAPDVAAATP